MACNLCVKKNIYIFSDHKLVSQLENFKWKEYVAKYMQAISKAKGIVQPNFFLEK